MLRALLLPVCLSSAMVLSACDDPAPAPDPAAAAHATCEGLAGLSTVRDGFLAYLPKSCTDAAADIAENASPRAAFRAKIYVDALARLGTTLSDLPNPPTDTGAYLIAREAGTLEALDTWLALRGDTHHSALENPAHMRGKFPG
jgi:hypothetical protein